MKNDSFIIKRVTKPLFIPGFIYGLRYPSLHISLKISGSITLKEIQDIESELSNLLPDFSRIINEQYEKEPINILLESFLYWVYAVGRSADIPVFQEGRIRHSENKMYLLWIPCSIKTQSAIFKIIEDLLVYINGSEDDIGLEHLTTLIKTIKSMFKGQTNVPRFYKAAYELGIPFFEITQDLQQYGHGSNMRLMDSSFTDRTSVIGARLSRDKLLTANVLSQAGIPIPQQVQVYSEKEALHAASKIGYPVVIKPTNLDGGAGVYAALASEKDVKSAFSETKKLSKNILVEKHIYGKDYRLNVFNGKVLWAIERVPAGVTGNGKETIEELIEKVNANPKRGEEGTHALLKRLILDTEAIGLLDDYGYTSKTVLEDGKFIPLRRKANISAGGTPVSVMDKIHPENYFLAVRTAQILNLDLAGIDLITKDISISWKKTGGAVCEVNGQPQLGGVTSSHVYAQVLNTLIFKKGRIPIVVIFGDKNNELSSTIRKFFESKSLRTGSLDLNGVSIGEKYISDGYRGVFSGGKMLMMDKNVDAAVICMNDASVLKTGLPFDYYDVLVLAGSSFHTPRMSSKDSKEFLVRESLNCILSSCRRSVIEVRELEPREQSKFKIKHSKQVSRKEISDVIANLFVDIDVKKGKE